MPRTQSSRRGFSVNVYIPSGDPEGLRIVEKSNWAGRGMVIPRAIYAENRKLQELDRTGVYLLVDQSEAATLPMLYVGEGDPVKDRLEKHSKEKDFWTHAVVFTSKDANLNKAHIQRLESRLIDLACRAKQSVSQNGTSPTLPSLSEADEAFVESFLDDMLLCLPIMGYRLFEDAATATASASPSSVVTLFLKAKGVAASGIDTSGGFVVNKGSRAVGDGKVVPSMAEYIPHVKHLRDDLIRQGVLAPDGDTYIFTEDYRFGSPSTAASVVMGRNANGRIDWKTVDGRSLKEVQDNDTVP